jgi:hypothetical protein
MSRISALLKQQCPQCNNSSIYKKGNFFSFERMHEHCTSCNCKFEIEPGFFFGAMFVSYALSVAQAITAYILAQFFLSSLPALISTIFLVLILLSPITYRFSRVIWMYIFISNQKA